MKLLSTFLQLSLATAIIVACSDKEVPMIDESAILFECDSLSSTPDDEASALSRLRAIGNQIMDDACNPVVLKGFAIIDPYFIAELENDLNRAYFEVIKYEWKANVIRVPVHPDLYSHYPGYLEKYVDPIVEWGNELGFYVLLSYHAHGNIITGESEQPDWRNTPPWQGSPYNSDRLLAERALTEMAMKYKGKPWVIYGSFNEPTFISWNDWQPEAERLVDVIHAIDKQALVTVSGVDWGYDLSGVSSNPVNRMNVVYETHPYPWKGESWKSDVSMLAKRYPVILGEWGFDNTRGSGTRENYGAPLITICNENRLGRIAWIWHHEWSPSIFKNKNQTLTEFGKLVKEDLSIN